MMATRIPALLLLLSVIPASGCDGPALPAGGAGTPALGHFTDGLGRQVAVPSPAERIVTLAPSNTELCFAVGAGAQVVGRDGHSDHPEEALRIPSIGRPGGKIDRERIVALKPDLVLAARINTPEEVRSIERLGLAVFMVGNPADFEGLYRNVHLVGRITGREDRAAELAAALMARVAAVEERARGVKERPLVFYELDGTDPTKPWTVGPDTFMDRLITLAGGRNLGGSQTRSFPRMSSEEIIRSDPQVIVLGDSQFGVTADSVARRAGWSGISAVRNGKVHVFDDNLASRPGPRLVEGLETLFALLHPEIAQVGKG